jgi:hypothetical protein
VLSFLVSTPTTGVDSILATYSLMGPLFAVFRPLAALVAGISVGVLNYFFEGKNTDSQSLPSHKHQRIRFRFGFAEFVRYSFLEIPYDIGKWLILGTIVGAVISVIIPQDAFARYLSFPFDFMAALILGIPMYVCSTGSIPIAVSLMEKGFSPGAALVFLIVGPSTNAITLSFVRARLGKRSFYQYLVSIIVAAVMLGLIFNSLWFIFGSDSRLTTGAGKMLSFNIKVISGVILLLIILFSFRQKRSSFKYPDTVVSVPDIHCKHCQFALESALRELEGVTDVRVDVEAKVVAVKGDISREDVTGAIRRAGYHPEEKSRRRVDT